MRTRRRGPVGCRATDLDELVDGVPAVLRDGAVGLDLDGAAAGGVVVDVVVPMPATVIERDPARGVVREVTSAVRARPRGTRVRRRRTRRWSTRCRAARSRRDDRSRRSGRRVPSGPISRRPAGSRTTSEAGSRNSPASPSTTPTTRPWSSRSTTVRMPALVGDRHGPTVGVALDRAGAGGIGDLGEPVVVVPQELGEQAGVRRRRRRHPAGEVVGVRCRAPCRRGRCARVSRPTASRVRSQPSPPRRTPVTTPLRVAHHVGRDAHRVGRRADAAGEVVRPTSWCGRRASSGPTRRPRSS